MGSLTFTNYCISIPNRLLASLQNINDFNKHCHTLVERIDQSKNDIFTLQEVSKDAIPYLRKLTKYELVCCLKGDYYRVTLIRKDRLKVDSSSVIVNQYNRKEASLVVKAIDIPSNQPLTIVNTYIGSEHPFAENLTKKLHKEIVKTSKSYKWVIGGGKFKFPELSSSFLKKEGYTFDDFPDTVAKGEHIFTKNILVKSTLLSENFAKSQIPPLTATIELSPVVKPAFKNNQPAPPAFRGELMKQLMNEITDTSLLKHLDALLTKHASPKKKNYQHRGLDSLERISFRSDFSDLQKIIKDDFEKLLEVKKKFQQPSTIQTLINQFNKCFENAQIEFMKQFDISPIKTPSKPLYQPLPKIAPVVNNSPSPKKSWTFLTILTAPFRLVNWIVQRIFHAIF